MRSCLVLLVLLASSPSGGQEVRDPNSELVEVIKWRQSSKQDLIRYLKFGLYSVGIGLGIWVVHRGVSWVTQSQSSSKRRSPAKNSRRLSRAERSFVDHLSEKGRDKQVTQERSRFEKAVEANRSLFHGDAENRQMLSSVRKKLGWTSSPTLDRSSSRRGSHTQNPPLELNQEMELFGTDKKAGFCLRATVVYFDESGMTLRLSDETDSPWVIGDEVQAYYWRPNDAGYLGRIRIEEVRKGRSVHFIVTPLAQVERQQKRIYVRVSHREEVKYLRIALSEAVEKLGREIPPQSLGDGWVEDLSGGGVRFATEAEFEPGDYIYLSSLAALDGREVLLRVVSKLPDNHQGIPRYGLQFVGLSVPEREAVVRKVFALQRQNLRERQERAEAGEQFLDKDHMPEDSVLDEKDIVDHQPSMSRDESPDATAEGIDEAEDPKS